MSNRQFIVAASLVALLAGTLWYSYGQEEGKKKVEREDFQLFQSGYALVVSGTYAEAVKIFEEFEKKYPSSQYIDDALFWKAFCYAEMEQYNGAIKVYRGIVEKYPDANYADDALFKIAELYEVRLHDYDKAIETYEELIKKYPSSPLSGETFLNLGNTQMKQSSISPEPSLKDADVQKRIGQNYNDAIDNLNRAQISAEKLNKENPRGTWVWKTAEKEIKLLQENKDYDWIPLTLFFSARNLKETREYGKAIEKLKKLLVDYPKAKIADDAELEIADCLCRSGDIAEALRRIEDFKKVYPESPLIPAADANGASYKKRLEMLEKSRAK